MSSTVRLLLTARTSDLACKPRGCDESIRDEADTTHDLSGLVPLPPLATSGVAGTAFVALPTAVVQIQRIWGKVSTGADVLMRIGGVAAFVLGASGALTLTDGWTLLFAVDGGATITVSFLAADNTPLLAAKRINYAAGFQVASVDALTGRLRLDGVKTGGPGARAKSRSFGAIDVLSGTALTALGLIAGSYYGDGDDVRMGSGPFTLTFPPGALPRRIELSGSASSAHIWVAGTAS